MSSFLGWQLAIHGKHIVFSVGDLTDTRFHGSFQIGIGNGLRVFDAQQVPRYSRNPTIWTFYLARNIWIAIAWKGFTVGASIGAIGIYRLSSLKRQDGSILGGEATQILSQHRTQVKEMQTYRQAQSIRYHPVLLGSGSASQNHSPPSHDGPFAGLAVSKGRCRL